MCERRAAWRAAARAVDRFARYDLSALIETLRWNWNVILITSFICDRRKNSAARTAQTNAALGSRKSVGRKSGKPGRETWATAAALLRRQRSRRGATYWEVIRPVSAGF